MDDLNKFLFHFLLIKVCDHVTHWGLGYFLNLCELTVGIQLPRDNGGIKASFSNRNLLLQIHGHYLCSQIFITELNLIMLLPL